MYICAAVVLMPQVPEVPSQASKVTCIERLLAAHSRRGQRAQASLLPRSRGRVQTLQHRPLTCARTCAPIRPQVLTLGITVAKYDLNFPAAPLPRNSTDNLAPLCLSLFNFNTLDDVSGGGWIGAGGVTGVQRLCALAARLPCVRQPAACTPVQTSE